MIEKILRLRKLAFSNSYWDNDAGTYAMVCGEGLRQVVDVPLDARVIYICVTENEPQHEHWFRLHKNRGIDWSDDYSRQNIDHDFQSWLTECYSDDLRYMTVKYNT